MNRISNIKKPILYFSIATISIIIMIFITLWFIDLPYRKSIPSLPELNSLSAQLQDQIKEADNKAHSNPSVENLGNLGMVYHSSTFYDKAKACYQLAVKKNASKWIWKYYLGYLNQEMGESEEALSNFNAIVKEHPNVTQAWYYIGSAYQNSGSFEKAGIAYSQITTAKDSGLTENATTRNDLFPLQTYASYQIARMYSDTKQYEKAEQTLKEIITHTKSFGPAYRLLGNVYKSRGDSSQSNYFIVRANDLADFFPPVDSLIDKLSQLSKSELYLLKQIDEAIKSYNPEWTIMLLNNALTNISNNRYLISKAIKLYLKLDNGKLALPYLKQHFEFYKNDVNELSEVAGLLNDKGFYAESTDYYTELVRLKPGNSSLQSSLAFALNEQGKKSEAVELMKKLMENDKKNVQTLMDGIHFMIVTGEKAEAKNKLSLLKQLSSNAKINKYEGMLAESDGNTALAITSYELACKKDPEDITTIQYLGNILFKLQQWDKALNHFKKAMEVHPNEPYLLERMGTLLVTCPAIQYRNYRVAKEYCERAFINIRSSSVIVISAARSLAMAYAAIGDKRNASIYLNITISMARNENYPADYLSYLENLMQQPAFRYGN